MKRNHQARRKAAHHQSTNKIFTRTEMNRYFRRFLIITLCLMIAAIAVAWVSVITPLTLTLPAQTLVFDKQADIDYKVVLAEDAFGDRRELPADQRYLTDTVDRIDVQFSYALQTDRDLTWQTGHQLNSWVEIRDRANPEQVLLSQHVPLKADQQQTFEGRPEIKESIALNFADYQAIAAAYAPTADIDLFYTLTVKLTTLSETQLMGGLYQVVEEPALIIPLQEPSFQINRQLPSEETIKVRQPVVYQLMLVPLPIAVYPSVLGAAIVLLILIFALTKSRPKNKFHKRLRKMLHQARTRLMLIGDKAWEPEWCIRATNFKAMVQTAKKLKHPIFCYIDEIQSVAYFYVYYGENNYCYIFGNPDPSAQTVSVGGKQQTMPAPAAMDTDEALSIPVLPESDAPETDQDNSPEIMLARLRIQTNTSR